VGRNDIVQWRYYHTVWFVMVFGWVTNMMVRAGLSPVLISIIEEFSLDYSQAGLIAAAFFYSYAIMQFPAGFIGDKIGRKSVLVACSFGWAIGCLVTGIAHSFTSLFVYRFLTGIAQGTYFSNDRPIIAFYTPKEKSGFGQGISFIGLGLGVFLGIVLAGIISVRLSWRWVFFLYAVPSFIAALLIFKKIKEPGQVDVTSQTTHGPTDGPKVSFSVIFKDLDLWLIYIAGIAAVYGTWTLVSWAPAMFKEIGIEELSRSSLFASMIGLSAIPGLITSGWLSDKLYRKGKGRKLVLSLDFVLAAVTLCCIGLVISIGVHHLVLMILVFIAGCFLWGVWAPFYSLISEIVPPAVHGSTYGLTNAIHFVGGFTAPWLTGIIKDSTGSFSLACHVAAGFCLVAALLVLSIRPSFRLVREQRITHD